MFSVSKTAIVILHHVSRGHVSINLLIPFNAHHSEIRATVIRFIFVQKVFVIKMHVLPHRIPKFDNKLLETFWVTLKVPNKY